MPIKRYLFFLSIILITLPVFAQKGHTNIEYFLLRKDSGHISINALDNGKIMEHAYYPAGRNTIYATDGIKYTVIIEKNTRTMNLFSLTNEEIIRKEIPFEMQIKSVLITGENIFAGGLSNRKGLIVHYSIDTKNFSLLEIPEDADFLKAKAIDDLLIDNDLLIAVDNIVMPKYVIYYKLSSDSAEYSHYKQLRTNGTYERIRSGRISNYLMAILSSTTGRGGGFDHITVYNKDDITKNLAVSDRTSSHIIQENDIELINFDDFIIIKDTIIIASRQKGLGIVQVNQDDLANRRKKEIDYDKFDIKAFEIENFIGLTVIPDTDKFIFSIKDEEGKIKDKILKL